MTLPRITVCGLGPGGADSVTTATLDAIERSTVRFLRTTRHPTAHLVAGAASFDHLYEAADSFDQVYAAIADALVAAATEAATDAASSEPGVGGSVLYAVPGSPLVLEDSVRRLRADGRVEVQLVPALSFLDEAWARLGVDPVDDGVRLVDGHRFAVQAAGERGPLLVAHVHAPWVLSEIKLALDAGDEQRAVVLQGLGTAEERVFEVAWPDLDRVVTPDHLTSLYLPELAAPVAAELAASVELMARLRRDCPWDRAQTHRSLRRYLLEEAYEVLEAIDRLPEQPDGSGGPAADELDADDGYELLEEELGDLWFQILFHAQLAAEAGRFTVADVARTLHDKLVGRHPHVFGGATVADAGEVVANWERIKQEEKQRNSVLDGIPAALPALSLADKVLQRAERAGWTTDTGDLGLSLAGLLPPGAGSDELGRALLALVVAGRASHLDAEAALRSAVTAADRRFRRAEESGTRSDSWVLG